MNAYLRAVTGEDFTAKDFRTWAGTVIAAETLRAMGAAETKTDVKRNVTVAVQVAAERLGNTPTICRQCYVHPAVVAAYTDGSLFTSEIGRRERALMDPVEGVSEEEARVLAFLRRVERDAAAAATPRAG